MGYLSSQPTLDEAAMRRAMIFGSVMASFNVEEFGTARVQRLTHDEINERFHAFKQMTHFEEIPFERAMHRSYGEFRCSKFRAFELVLRSKAKDQRLSGWSIERFGDLYVLSSLRI